MVRVDANDVTVLEPLRRVFPLMRQLADDGLARDTAGNRRLTHAQYASLMILGLLNPTLTSMRSIVAASTLRKVQRTVGGPRVSLGAFSEAAGVFDPRRLAGIVRQLREELGRQSIRAGSGPSAGDGRTILAIDGSVFTTLSAMGGHLLKWRLHAEVCSGNRTVRNAAVEPDTDGTAERRLAEAFVRGDAAVGQAGLYLLDRGYRSARLFNAIVEAGGDYVARLCRNDGVVAEDLIADDSATGTPTGTPTGTLSASARAMGIVADVPITYGRCDHPVRRITLVPADGVPSSARQGRVRTDQAGRDELVLATTLPACGEDAVPAEDVVRLYRQRWQVELFFRFLKHTLGCRQLWSTQTAGVQIQLYCGLIVSLLLALCCGRDITKRQYEIVMFYIQGWAEEDELAEALGLPPPKQPTARQR